MYAKFFFKSKMQPKLVFLPRLLLVLLAKHKGDNKFGQLLYTKILSEKQAPEEGKRKASFDPGKSFCHSTLEC